jgi:hypothetical protein
MYGDEYDLFLGSGLREHENLISIDIDPLSVRTVKIQITRVTERQHWISTHLPSLAAGVVAATNESEENSYAIVPESLPEIDDLDAWGREDIRNIARKWPSNLKAAYDLALLEYAHVTEPLPLPCVSISNEQI